MLGLATERDRREVDARGRGGFLDAQRCAGHGARLLEADRTGLVTLLTTDGRPVARRAVIGRRLHGARRDLDPVVRRDRRRGSSACSGPRRRARGASCSVRSCCSPSPARSSPRGDAASGSRALALGASTAFMNQCFYQAIARIPLGGAVAIEYLGPFLVAALGKRSRRHFAFVAARRLRRRSRSPVPAGD